MLALALLVGLLAPTGGAAARVAAAASVPSPPASPASPASQPPVAARWTLDELLSALREVESGGSPDAGRARGDHGAALGPYQIHRAYWQDARIAGSYEQCRDPDYARAVVLAYWRRYCPLALEAVDAERLARVHNGGPAGHTKAGTRAFWLKVQAALERQRALA